MKGQHKPAGKPAYKYEREDDLDEGFDNLFDDEGYFREKVGADRVATKRRIEARRTLERLREQMVLSDDLQDFDQYLK